MRRCGIARRQQIGKEDGERALARSVWSNQAPRPVAVRVVKAICDLRKGAADGGRDEIAVERIRRTCIAIEVHRALKAATDLDQAQETRRIFAVDHWSRVSAAGDS